jgi:hypothetical protein
MASAAPQSNAWAPVGHPANGQPIIDLSARNFGVLAEICPESDNALVAVSREIAPTSVTQI